jgi:hypothetical protein
MATQHDRGAIGYIANGVISIGNDFIHDNAELFIGKCKKQDATAQ